MYEFHALIMELVLQVLHINQISHLYFGVGPPSVPFCGTPIVLVTFNSCLLIMALTEGFEPSDTIIASPP